MSDTVKLIIEIPKEDFKKLVNPYQHNEIWCNRLKRIVMNGTPLPENHGRLVDADYLKDVILLHNFHGNNKNIVPYADRRGYRLRQREVDEAIINAPTIIEADTESEG